MNRFSFLLIIPVATLLIVALSSICCGCISSVSPAGTAPLSRANENPVKGFRPVRKPVLGLTLEHDPSRALYRLVSRDKPRDVLCSGSREHCEGELVAILEERHGDGNVNWPLPTLGGKQFWADHVVLSNWRVQENVHTGHFRLLDPHDTRMAWGSFEHCRVPLERVRLEHQIAPRSDHLGILLHGRGRSKDAFGKLQSSLETAGYEVATINYPSSQRPIREHSEQLARVLAAFNEIRTVSFVTHSLGAIVLRGFLSTEALQDSHDLDIGRAVMLAPPNQGSIAAEILQDWFLFKTIAGEAGQELTPENVGRIPAPSCEFGVIAGGDGEAGYNPLLDGDGDGVVTVESTRLKGMRDFLVVPASHTLVIDNEQTLQAIPSFLESGAFGKPRAE